MQGQVINWKSRFRENFVKNRAFGDSSVSLIFYMKKKTCSNFCPCGRMDIDRELKGRQTSFYVTTWINTMRWHSRISYEFFPVTWFLRQTLLPSNTNSRARFLPHLTTPPLLACRNHKSIGTYVKHFTHSMHIINFKVRNSFFSSHVLGLWFTLNISMQIEDNGHKWLMGLLNVVVLFTLWTNFTH